MCCTPVCVLHLCSSWCVGKYNFHVNIELNSALKIAAWLYAEARTGQPDGIDRFQNMFSWLLGNLLTQGRITFAPNTTEVSGLVTHLLTESELFKEVYGGTFSSEKDAVDSALSNVENDKPIWAIVVVNNLDPAGGNVNYKIRMNFTTVPRTAKAVYKRRTDLQSYYKRYYTSGFLSLQNAVNSYVFKLAPNRSEVDILSKKIMWGAPFPVAAHSRNRFYKAVGPMLGLLMCLTTLYPLGMLVKALVEEKETRAKETMYIMGLKSWVFSISWATTYLVVFLLISLSVTLLLSLTVFPRSDLSLLLLLFFLFTTSLTSFGFFLSVFFSKAKLAAIVAPFVHFGAIMPRYIFFRASDGQAISGKSIAALLPPTAFTFGADMVGHYEGANFGITWANIFEDEFSMAWILGLLVIDTFLYAFLAWYLEQVLPSEYGFTKSPLFLFSPAWWRGNRSVTETKYQKLTNIHEEEGAEPAYNEPYKANGSQPAVMIRNLKKVYPGGKIAVEDLTLEVYEDHITALLGHNGAGKSTTISMLTGLIRPSGGDAHIWGHSICDNMNDVRRTIGVCPQQNVLFNHLTVKEHLELFAALKGVPKLYIDHDVQDMVSRLGLSDKTNTPASSLSGGMKRKLQIGLAMMGRSRVVFLDEPTSGLDPQSRRAVWELLRTFKSGRAIILTTHYMDEADLLCDRIAIMSEGRLKCSGSSLFLKAKFGVGYNLSMTRSSASCNDTAVTAFVHKHIPQAILLSSAGGELAFQLPLSNKGAFAQFFEELEQRQEELYIGGYGISMTTLEEVFLRLANDSVTADVSKPLENRIDRPAQIVNEPMATTYQSHNGNAIEISNYGEHNKHHVMIPVSSQRVINRNSQSNSFRRAYSQMVLKRVLIARRDWKGLANSVLLPVFAISLVMLILKLNIDPAGPSLELDFRMFRFTGQRTIIPVAGVSSSDMSTLLANDYLEFQARDNLNNSIALSEDLLQTYLHTPPRYGALVFNDTLWPTLNISSLQSLNMTQSEGLFNSSGYGFGVTSNTSTYSRFLTNLFQSPSGQGIFSPVTLLFNTSSDHSLPALVQELMQTRLKANLVNSSATMKVSNHPLPLTKTEFLEIQTVLSVLAALFVLIPFCYLGASYAVFVVRERVVKAKLLQMVSGASCVAYWTATYTWDLITYAATLALTMLIFELYQDKSFVGSWSKAGATLSVLMSFGASVIPLTYCYSFGFLNHANAQVAIAGIHFLTGFGMLVGSLVMGEIDETKALNEKLVHLYHLFPPFNLGRSLVQLSALDFRDQVLGKPSDPFKWDILGRPLTYMIVEIFGYMVLTILIDNGTLRRSSDLVWDFVSQASQESRLADSLSDKLPLKEDVDVCNERKRVEGGQARSDTVVVQGLRKVYPARGLEVVKVAVRDLSLGIPPRECFGFLGVNGAGKTTTLSMLSGDIRPTAGEAYINGHSVLKDLAAAQKQIGYCPQFDPLLDLMTGREHLHMYANLKGLPKADVKEAVNALMEAVGLQKYVDRVAGAYSGGNKRKLALAIALVGNPAVVFLDEPSSGMDPVARRSMWNLITDAVLEQDMSVVLTTHSMEECEALCSRVGVMVAGSLVCLGSIQHIKSRFGSGYTVELRCACAIAVEALHQFMSLSFPSSRLEEEHLTRVKYSIPVKDFTLSQVFSTLEREKDRLELEDYSVSQSTLEQVFLSLANGQPEEIEC